MSFKQNSGIYIKNLSNNGKVMIQSKNKALKTVFKSCFVLKIVIVLRKGLVSDCNVVFQ